MIGNAWIGGSVNWHTETEKDGFSNLVLRDDKTNF
jgi:hypothetical protein